MSVPYSPPPHRWLDGFRNLRAATTPNGDPEVEALRLALAEVRRRRALLSLHWGDRGAAQSHGALILELEAARVGCE